MNARRGGVSTIWAMFSRGDVEHLGIVVGVEELLDLFGERAAPPGRNRSPLRPPHPDDLTGRQIRCGARVGPARPAPGTAREKYLLPFTTPRGVNRARSATASEASFSGSMSSVAVR